MNKAEWWVLESVVDIKRPVDWFATTDPVEFSASFNSSLADFVIPELRAAFVRLALEGALCIRHLTRESIDRGANGDVLTLTRGEIEAALVTPGPRWYELTPYGGKLWEAYAVPDWGLYVSVAYGSDDAIIETQGRTLAEKYVAWQHYNRYGRVLENTIQIEPLAPWQATYWKTLPHGWRISFTYEADGPSLPWERGERPEIRHWFDTLRRWYRSSQDNG